MIKFREKPEPQVANYDIELIQLVKEHELLYNTRNSDYRNLPLRATIWSGIALALIIDDRKLLFELF